MCAFSHKYTRCTQTNQTTLRRLACSRRSDSGVLREGFLLISLCAVPTIWTPGTGYHTTTVYECQGPRQTGWKTGSSILTSSNAGTARPLTLLRPAETLERNWLNTNKRQEMVMLTIVLLNTINSWKIKLTAILWHVTYSTDYYHRLTLDGWFANLEQHHWSPQLTVTRT